ncbi:LuxR family transcriptional regulator [Flavobacterium longum]|uniref:response regulator n=1 Tax=Flavobacterium longum TaxID=1299340 RepID=UPI0039E8A2B8
MLRVGIVDDHQLFRKSLALMINSFQNTKVVIEASNGRIFLELLEDNPIDLVLLDIQMPEMNGFETCRTLQQYYPEIKILVVSQLTTKESIHKIMELGADGYFTKNSDPEQLEHAINTLHENGFYFGTELGKVLREAILWEKKKPTKPVEVIAALTGREIDIIRMAAQEMSSGEIADRLSINIRTVDTHRKRIMEKTNTKNFIGVVLYALRHEFITMEELS